MSHSSYQSRQEQDDDDHQRIAAAEAGVGFRFQLPSADNRLGLIMRLVRQMQPQMTNAANKLNEDPSVLRYSLKSPEAVSKRDQAFQNDFWAAVESALEGSGYRIHKNSLSGYALEFDL